MEILTQKTIWYNCVNPTQKLPLYLEKSVPLQLLLNSGYELIGETDFVITTKTPWEQRLCPYCLSIGANPMENESPFLVSLPIYSLLGTKFQGLEFSSNSHTLFNDSRCLALIRFILQAEVLRKSRPKLGLTMTKCQKAI